jgi:Fur family peroxide stress response transcriptional regulator
MITDKKGEYRNTKQRTAILELLRSTKSHPKAAWLHERLKPEYPDISLGTVYRNLAVLAEQGLVIAFPTGDGTDRFDADTGEHYHVLCERCGRLDDVPYRPEPARAPDDRVPLIRDEDAGDATGYRVTGHRLFFFGICPDCLAKDRG